MKKAKRGEAYLFNSETGQLTEEALSVCKFCGVDSRELYPRSVETFVKKSVSQQEANRQMKAYEAKRQDLVSLVLQNIMKNDGKRSIWKDSLK